MRANGLIQDVVCPSHVLRPRLSLHSVSPSVQVTYWIRRPAKTTRTEVMATARKLSGLQKDVLSLYRSLLRVAAQKDRAEGQHTPITTLLSSSIGGAGESTTTSHARAEFRRQCAEVKRSDFRTIEYLIRKGRKHVNLLQMPGVKGTSSFGGGAR